MRDAEWEKAGRARDELLARWGAHPSIRMIDIGLDEDRETVVLRVHLEPGGRPVESLPSEVAGLPVRTLSGNYRPE